MLIASILAAILRALLDFRAVGNKWQIVHSWLRDRLKD
jgi:hypothetical protein